MAFFSFGEYISGKGYKEVDERVMRGSSGIMLLLGFIAFVNGFVIKNYVILPYISGFLALNFFLAVFINPKIAPTVFVARIVTLKQSPLLIGAIQKRFAYSLGMILSVAIFALSIFLLTDVSYFEPVCMLCLICLLFLFLETAFGICVGCKLYHLSVRVKLLKAPEEKPNCMGDSCEV
ncbi:DUF4395 family protein [Plebeiibacterium marinum]|uniref:DUF4395 domain-containing protein n=1 Tax=Plebeiibacterium marinum TaxID=2992111 RepID=A0AAE3SM20_9BACT|nr:DUF4395 family protein [Plebeiobacterium marinum]MCW3807100.1 DUF4395 domain-containing protein [Plebeiobacterium marinum]